MRGKYKYGDVERGQFKAALLELCRNFDTRDDVDLSTTILSLHDCDCLLEEIGYDRDDYEINGWEGDIWTRYCHRREDAPILCVRACGYSGDLDLYFGDRYDEICINTEVLVEIIYEKWGKE